VPDILPFSFPDTGERVRTVLIENEPWFVAADVAKILGYRDAANAVRTLRERQKGTHPLSTPGGLQNLTVVSEPGAYRLAMRSNLPAAERFQDWLAEEVIPSVRRTGQYALPVQPPDELEMAERIVELIREKRAEQGRRELAEAKVAELAPAARSWDVLASAHGDFAVAEAANMLARDPKISTGRDRLFDKLAELNWIYRYRGNGKWHPYQTAIEAGRLVSRAQSYEDPRTGERVIDAPQVRVTVKGVHDLHRRLGGVGPIDRYIAEVLAEGGVEQGQLDMLDVAS
jgi:prophage antirepressor-like protein